MNKIISPIAIDLGGKNTGVFYTQYDHGEVPAAEYCKAATIIMPEEGGKMTWSQVNRTATRHRLRSNKRAKLAKRLLRIVLESGYHIKLSPNLWDALCGLLNRRGYNRIEVELDMTLLSETEPYWFSEMFPCFNAIEPLSEQWDQLSQDLQRLREFESHDKFSLNINDVKKMLGNYEKSEKDEIVAAFQLLRKGTEDILSQKDYGHKHRADYLKTIDAEIKSDSRFQILFEKIAQSELHRLIGNISNFQLRTLRWYFNDISMKSADKWIPVKLHKVISRWIEGWHCDGVEKINRAKLLSALRNDTNILHLLSSIDPVTTIPPYEDQNNRRPPKDQTLWLCPLALDKAYGDKWLIWASNLERHNAQYIEGIDDMLVMYDRHSRLPVTVGGERKESAHELKKLKASYLLQRLLDRTRGLDNYALRLLIKDNETQKTEANYSKLSMHIGAQHTQTFIDFCRRYYAEVDLAKQSLWEVREDNLLERAALNPPKKEKILNRLIGNIMGKDLNEGQFEAFKNECWLVKVDGRSTLRGLCKTVEDNRKNHGNLYNERLRRIKYRVEQLGEKPTSFKKDEKDIWRSFEKSLKAATAIANYFKQSEEQQSKYNNPFSMAQLYTLLETQRHGFSSTTLAAHAENYWRMGSYKDEEGNDITRCARLPADAVRPFDGVLKRVLEHQAYRIGLLKAEQIKSSAVEKSEINIVVLAEENRFSFSEELLSLKRKNTSKKKVLNERLKEQSIQWQGKNERIKEASQNICPYTGKAIGSIGEIDHVLPRANSMSQSGTVFNSEANLIWCSRKGNQDKGEKAYRLNDLHADYLKAQFKTSNLATITEVIENTLESLPKDFLFDTLSTDKQRAIRHALFLEENNPTRKVVQRRLATQQATRVNGTQAWLIKRIITVIKNELNDWAVKYQNELVFNAARIQAEPVSQIRRQLGEVQPKLAKQERQSAASHAIDALCVIAAAASQPKLMDNLALGAGLSEDMAWLASTMPESIDIVSIERKPRYDKSQISSEAIFKEGLYAEHFLPLLQKNEALYVGFDISNNAVEIVGEQPLSLREQLMPFLEHKSKTSSAQKMIPFERFTINKEKAFNHLYKVATEPCAASELKIADLLEALHYTTIKKDVWQTLYDQNKKTFVKREDILKKKNFKLSIKVKDGKKFKSNGEVHLPVENDWLRLCNHKEIKPLLGEKIAEPINKLSLLNELFNPGSKRSHQKTRRVFSLPVVASPSGGFRIKRKTPDGKYIWQLMSIEGTYASGFDVNDNKIEWNNTTILSQLTESKNLTLIGSRYAPAPDDSVKFNHWLKIPCEDTRIHSLEIAPGTKDRRYIRITQSFVEFSSMLKVCSDEQYSTPESLGSEIKLDAEAFQKVLKNELFGEPRSNLFIQKSGKVVTYWYIVESSNSSMKAAYFNAYKQSMLT